MARKYDIGEEMISQKQIFERAAEIGRTITDEFAGQEVVVIGILKGAVLWLSDLIKHIELDVHIDFMAVSSYGALTKSTGAVKILKDLDTSIEGKNVIIVEDIVDSGITLNYLKNYLLGMNPKVLKICTLLDKPAGRQIKMDADYIGFTVGDQFIVGYGLDYSEKYRNLPYITCLTSGS
ncbi:MAG: hypoxanthine phosphoribosyltransferase [Clostridiales bacterium]|nr:hypoxanthine phosphoribosyltransferase [Clostridiales bacterium]